MVIKEFSQETFWLKPPKVRKDGKVDKGEDFLASGGFGRVYRCYLDNVNPVAIKFIKTPGSNEEITAAQKIAKKEMAILETLDQERRKQQPGMATRIMVYYGTIDFLDAVGLIMEYVPRGDLKTLMKKQEDDRVTLPWDVRLRIMLEVAEGTSYLHSLWFDKRLTHNDLKPQNVLVDEEFHIKICDFGGSNIATYTNTLTLMQHDNKNTVHTIHFTAPEFLKDDSLRRTRAMDVFSYGMLTYYVMTGKHPFGSSYITIVKDNIINGKRPIDSDKGIKENAEKNDHGIITTMFTMMARCWSHDRENRPEITEVVEKFQQEMDQIPSEVMEKHITALKKMLPLKDDSKPDERINLSKFDPFIIKIL